MTHSHTCPHTHGHRFAGTHTGTGRRTHQMRPQHSQSKSAPTALPTLNVSAALSGSLCPSLSFHPVPLSRFSLPLFPCVCLLPLTLIFALFLFLSHFFPPSVSLLPSQSFAVSLTFILALFPFLTFSLSPSFFYSLALSLTFSPPPPPSPSPSLSFQQISALAPKRLTAHNLSHVTQKQSRAVAL